MQPRVSLNSFNTRATLETAGGPVDYFQVRILEEQGLGLIADMPWSIKIMLESLLRNENGREVTRDDILRLAACNPAAPQSIEVPYKPARVLLQDFTGVPCVVDLAAMRSAMRRLGGDPRRINPRIPVDLVIDHSLSIDAHGCPDALRANMALEFERNAERYAFLKWGQQAFDNFRVIPPGCGICHQINLEYLATVVRTHSVNGHTFAFPDTLVGTDSHTTMINGLGIAGWGVGGIEAEAVMLGQPLYMAAPPVIGLRLTGCLPEHATATDLVLTVTDMLRTRGVVGTFVEFFGPGLSRLSVPDRTTVANMAPEYGATMGFFPVDAMTIDFLQHTGRPTHLIDLVERYCRAQGLFRTDATPDPSYREVFELDLGSVRPCLAGPSRPQDRVLLSDMPGAWRASLRAPSDKRGFAVAADAVGAQETVRMPDGSRAAITHGTVVLASITSCTNTSNPSAMLTAGLLARNAAAAGLRSRPWVKTSLAPGSTVVTGYLRAAGLLDGLEQLGFHVAGYGCATCIGNSGPLPDTLLSAINTQRLITVAVVSGNRNFEGRIHPQVRACYLASPPLVIAYALAGTIDIDLQHDPLGTCASGTPVYLKDIWPSDAEVSDLCRHAFDPETYRAEYDGVEESCTSWNTIAARNVTLFDWDADSTYIQHPSFFDAMPPHPDPIRTIRGARVLAMLGSSITTDHISPAGSIAPASPAGHYLIEHGVAPGDFNSYGSRRGNHHVMTRGTFAHIRLRNRLAPGTEGGWTAHLPGDEIITIYDAAMRYYQSGTPCIVIAGQDYGMGSSRDWAAKGTRLLGVRAVIAESFERIHRSNLVGMGVLPLQFEPGRSAEALGLTGRELYTIALDDALRPGSSISITAALDGGAETSFTATCRLDSMIEVDYYRHGGILPAVLRGFLAEKASGKEQS